MPSVVLSQGGRGSACLPEGVGDCTCHRKGEMLWLKAVTNSHAACRWPSL